MQMLQDGLKDSLTSHFLIAYKPENLFGSGEELMPAGFTWTKVDPGILPVVDHSEAQVLGMPCQSCAMSPRNPSSFIVKLWPTR